MKRVKSDPSMHFKNSPASRFKVDPIPLFNDQFTSQPSVTSSSTTKTGNLNVSSFSPPANQFSSNYFPGGINNTNSSFVTNSTGTEGQSLNTSGTATSIYVPPPIDIDISISHSSKAIEYGQIPHSCSTRE